jgi:hypothetical protein
MLLILFIVGCLSYELKQINMSIDHMAAHKHIYVVNNNTIYNISKDGEILNNITMTNIITSITTFNDKLIILDNTNTVTFYNKIKFPLVMMGVKNYNIRYVRYWYLAAIGKRDNDTIVAFYHLAKGHYISHCVINGLYHDLSTPDDLLMNVNVERTSFIYGIEVSFGQCFIYLKIDTTDEVMIGQIYGTDKLVLIAEYEIYLYDYDAKLLQTIIPKNVSIIFDPIIYQKYIIYRDFFSSNEPFIQFIDFTGNKLFELKYGYKCSYFTDRVLIDIYGNIMSHLCGILNLWINQ